MNIVFDSEVVVANREVCTDAKVMDMAVTALALSIADIADKKQFPNSEELNRSMHMRIADVLIQIENMYAKGLIDQEAIQAWVTELQNRRRQQLYNGSY